MYESPTLTTQGAPAPGPSANTFTGETAGTAMPVATNANAIPNLRMNTPMVRDVRRT